MAGVIEFQPSRKFAKQAKTTRRPRKKPDVSSNNDPRVKIANRTFEVTRCYVTGETVIERKVRIRIKKGGLEDEVYLVGERQCYVGMVSEHLPRDKWSPYTWGHVPVEGTDWVREVVSDEPTTKLTKDEKADD